MAKFIWTDASWYNGETGVGVVIQDDNGQYQFSSSTTSIENSNSAELFAALFALLKVEKTKEKVCLFTDNTYVVDCLKDFTKCKSLKDKLMAERIHNMNLDLFVFHRSVEKGHKINPQKIADHISKLVRRKQIKEDQYYRGLNA